MPYSTGEDPMIADAVVDHTRRRGIVTHVIHYGTEHPELVVEWDDGTLGIRCSPDEIALVKRLSETLSFSR